MIYARQQLYRLSWPGFVFAIQHQLALAEAGAMGVMIPVTMADLVPASLLPDLHQLHCMPVLVLAPAARSAVRAPRLPDVPIRVLRQLLSVPAMLASAMGLHGIPVIAITCLRVLLSRQIIVMSIGYLQYVENNSSGDTQQAE